jgi:hypothetical protein
MVRSASVPFDSLTQAVEDILPHILALKPYIEDPTVTEALAVTCREGHG